MAILESHLPLQRFKVARTPSAFAPLLYEGPGGDNPWVTLIPMLFWIVAT